MSTEHATRVGGVETTIQDRPRKVRRSGRQAGSGSSSDSGSSSGSATTRYRLLEELGRGGMGVVFKAYDSKLDRDVAIKVLRTVDPEDFERFHHEATTTAGLRHPNIVPVFDAGMAGGDPYLVMEIVEGESLKSILGHDGPFDPDQAARLACALARALAYAHAQGVLHRDLKPANVILSLEGEPRLTDFGLAVRLADKSRLTSDGEIVGTPSYMAPEQAEGDTLDVRTDVYGLGATLYELLVGHPAFVGTTPLNVIAAVLEREPAPPSESRPAVDSDLDAICLKCLEKDPADRYSSASMLVEDLERYLEGEPVVARPLTPGERRRRWLRRQALPFGLALAGAAVAGSAWAGHTIRENHELAVLRQREARSSLSARSCRQGVAAYERGQLSEALAHLNRAIETDPTLAEPYSWRGLLQCRERNYKAGQEDLAQALRLEPEEPDHLVRRGEALLAQDRPREAEVDLTRALELDPGNPRAMAQRGRARERLGRTQEALQDLNRAEELGHTSASLLALRALVRAPRRDFQGALSDAQRALEMDERQPLAHYALGRVLEERREYQRAADAFDRALVLDPELTVAWLARGRANNELARYHAAVADYTRALEIDPRSTEAFSGRGHARYSIGELERAEADHDRALELDPYAARPALNRAFTRLERGDLEGAREDLDRFLDRFPSNTPQVAQTRMMFELYARGRALMGPR